MLYANVLKKRLCLMPSMSYVIKRVEVTIIMEWQLKYIFILLILYFKFDINTYHISYSTSYFQSNSIVMLVLLKILSRPNNPNNIFTMHKKLYSVHGPHSPNWNQTMTIPIPPSPTFPSSQSVSQPTLES